MNLRNAAIFAAFLFSLLAVPLSALEVPAAPTRWFTDAAGLVDITNAAALDRKLEAFEKETGAQFIVYTIPSLEGDPVEDFTMRAAEKWKVGQKKYDNGLILFIFPNEKKVRIEVGYGLEGTITDAFSSRVIRETIAPHFQKNDWAGGINAGADQLMAQIKKGEAPVEPNQPQGSGDATGFDPQFLIFIVFIFFVFLLPMLRRSRGGGCGGCLPLFFMGGGGGTTFGGGGGGFGGGFGGGGGGFSGGGGGFGGGGSTGGW
jgi:uncharacterized protein